MNKKSRVVRMKHRKTRERMKAKLRERRAAAKSR